MGVNVSVSTQVSVACSTAALVATLALLVAALCLVTRSGKRDTSMRAAEIRSVLRNGQVSEWQNSGSE